MKNIYLIFISLLLLLNNKFSFAQEIISKPQCHYGKGNAAEKPTIGHPSENNYDVKYVKLDISMSNTSTILSGNVITKAQVVASLINQYVFELLNVLTIDSVLVNGSLCTVSTLGDIRMVTMPFSLTFGDFFIAQVFYHGTPPSGGLYAATGINTIVSPSWGAHATFTLSESYHAKEWWPCKQSLQDKIDSSDVWITVADSLKAGSNGLLNAITTIDANHKRYEWKERYPIDYYLISAAVSTYIDYSYYMHFTGSTDSMLVQNYIYTNPGTLTAFQSVIDSTGMMIDYFSSIYGRYPFWQEKYGHCIAPLGGGMEHQTMTTCGNFSGMLVSHELAHQWFGDNVTCRTWSNIFVNEGLASYSEDLFYDHFNSHAGMIGDIIGKQANVLSYDTGSINCPDTTESRVFDSRLSYDKGACVLHMLRFVVNNDSLFFAAYRLYQLQLKDSTGTIMDFKNAFENVVGITVNGVNLDTFFNQWFYLQGYPKYSISWNQVGTDVYIKIIQNGAIPASVPMFTLPIELKFHSTTVENTFRTLNNTDIQYYHFTWSHAMTNLFFDPNSWLLYKLNGAIVHDTSLVTTGITEVLANTETVFPNPAHDFWQISNLTGNNTAILIDISGKKIWQESNVVGNVLTIPAMKYEPGIYVLKITTYDCEVSKYFKLIKY